MRFVGMLDGTYIEGKESAKTSGVCGCLATLVYTKGDLRQGILAHYPPTKMQESISKINSLVSDHPEMIDADLKIAVILYHDSVSSRRISAELELGLRDILGEKIAVKKISYSDYPGNRGVISNIEDDLREVVLSLASNSWTYWLGCEKFY